MSPTLLASLFQALANFAVLFLLIMYLQGVRRLSPLDASLLLVPGYLLGGVVGPFAGRLSDRVGVVWPATVGLAVEIIALAVYAQVGVVTPLWVVGAGGFFPANNAAVMKLAPGRAFGTASGLLRTFANVGMVFSFAVAILVAARSIPKSLAFAIFVGTTRLSHHLATVFTSGVHAAFYSSMAFMALAAVLSATRVMGRGSGGSPRGRARVGAGDSASAAWVAERGADAAPSVPGH